MHQSWSRRDGHAGRGLVIPVCRFSLGAIRSLPLTSSAAFIDYPSILGLKDTSGAPVLAGLAF